MSGEQMYASHYLGQEQRGIAFLRSRKDNLSDGYFGCAPRNPIAST
jgi:hypothetical protein